MIKTERIELWVQAAELRPMPTLVRARNMAVYEKFEFEQLLLTIERTVLQWFDHVQQLPPTRLAQLEKDLEAVLNGVD